MKLGLIGRPETARGLGIQTQEFYRHMPVQKVLQIDMPTVTGPRDDNAFSTPIHGLYNSYTHALDPRVMVEFLRGLDVVFTAETPYDWSFLDMARELGVKTVVQGNPEFIRHGSLGFENLPHPDAWWWPTSWRTEVLPAGKVMPVPMPDVPMTRSTAKFAPLRVLHVAGKRATADRNGTDLFMQALQFTTEPMEVTLVGVDGDLPMMMPRRNITLNRNPNGVSNRWDLYKDQHILVLPRRYGGLCLPALEAMACGVPVAMPKVSPNLDWPIIGLPLQRTEELWLAGGHIDCAITDVRLLSTMLDEFAFEPKRLDYWGDEARARTYWWNDGGTANYIEALEHVLED